jgi:hypothetical protein
MGSIDVLSTGRGHLEITFDPANEADKEKAKKTVEDLLAKGYKLIVHEDGEDKPVLSFNPETYAYTVLETGTDVAKPTKEVPAAQADTTAYRPVAGG